VLQVWSAPVHLSGTAVSCGQAAEADSSIPPRLKAASESGVQRIQCRQLVESTSTWRGAPLHYGPFVCVRESPVPPSVRS
jgi:hypothetical protein